MWCVFVWCSVLVDGVLCSELVLTLGVYCYYIIYYTIIHILLYLILYSPSSSLPIFYSSSLFHSPLLFILLDPYLLFFLFSSYLPLSPSSLLFFSLPSQSLIFLLPLIPIFILILPPHSFYTCRYLHILIYIQSGYLCSLSLRFHSILVGTYIYLFIFQQFDPAQIIGGMSRVV